MQTSNQWRGIFNHINLLLISIAFKIPVKEVRNFIDDTLWAFFLINLLFIRAFFFFFPLSPPSAFALLFILKILNTWLYFKAASVTFIVLTSIRLFSLSLLCFWHSTQWSVDQSSLSVWLLTLSPFKLLFSCSIFVSFSNLRFPLRSPLKVHVSCFSFLPCQENLATASIKVIIRPWCKNMVPLTFFITR